MDSRLHYLVAVAQAGSFTAAARAVGVTQSAVTRGVADLERHLGCTLFHRTSQGALLTEYGRDFAIRAARVLEETRELLEGDSAPGDPYAGVLRVGICPASLEWVVTDSLNTLLARRPSVRIELTASTFDRIVQDVRNRTLDVAVGFDAAFSDWPGIQRQPMSALRSKLFVRRGHPLLNVASPTLADLAAYDFLSPSDSKPYGAPIRDIYESQGIDWRRRIHLVDYFPTVRSMVRNSDAIGVVAEQFAQTPVFARHFVALDRLELLPPASLCCATRARTTPKPAVRAFTAALSNDLASAWPEAAAHGPVRKLHDAMALAS